jgi:4-hydroxy-tetrahydrodipicolinate synthase
MFKGSITALVTPFKGDNLDINAFEKFIEFQISNGTNGIVPCGTTGESPTISHDEHKKLIEVAVKSSNGRIPVIAGTGSNCTEEAVEMTKFAEQAKADAALVVTPYYNKPTQEGLYQHYKKINDNCGIPIIIYNIPGRSVVDMSVDTMSRLYELKNIVGVKDATGDLDRVTQQKNKMGNDFIMLSGNDENTLEFNRLGGVGCISVSANVAPQLCSEFHSLCNSKKFDEAKPIFEKLLPLHDVMFVESNPVPAKYSLNLMGMMSEDVRLPLVTAQNSSKEKIKAILKSLSLI